MLVKGRHRALSGALEQWLRGASWGVWSGVVEVGRAGCGV